MKKTLLKSMLVAGMLAIGMSAQAQVYAETDMTAQFESLTKTESWTAGVGGVGYTATQFCPAVTTNSGKTVQMIESYQDGNGAACTFQGDVFYATVSGLAPGTYKIELYGGAAYTFGRGFTSEAFSEGTWTAGDKIESDTGVKLFAISNNKEYDKEIPIYYATNFPDGAATAVLEGIEVGSDGKVKIGMNKTSKSTNWHIIQLKGVTAQVDVQALLNDEIEAAGKMLEDYPNGTDETKSALQDAITAAKTAVSGTSAEEIQKALKDLKEAESAYKASIQGLIPNGKYYLIAMDLEDNNLMAAGKNWGTMGIVNNTGLDLKFTYDVDNDNYTIDTNLFRDANNHFLGSNLFLDSPAFGWSIEEDEVYGHCIYAMFDGVKKYISVNLKGELELSETAYAWAFIQAEFWDQFVLLSGLQALEEATPEKGVDATFLLKDPQFNRYDNRWVAWVVSSDCTNKNLGGGCTGTCGNGCAESFHSPFTISQVVENAPFGTYKLTAQGFYRQDDSMEEDAPLFFANDITAAVLAKTGSEGSMADASVSFEKGEYTINPITVEFDEGTLTVGIKGTATHQWVIWDNFQLIYYGPTTTAISEVTTTQQPAAIFNLAGQRVEKAQKGLYIQNGRKFVSK